VIVRFKPFAPTLLLLLLFTLPSSVTSFSQNSGQGSAQFPGLGPSPGITRDEHENQERAKIERDMAKRANQERQARLQRDTENLLKLATELKQYVDKSNEHTLSLDVVKKAEEIEKLAHSVKEKMKSN
jgi:membrane protein involved in colicin uptake